MKHRVMTDDIEFGTEIEFKYTTKTGDKRSPSLLVLDNDGEYIHGIKTNENFSDSRVMYNSIRDNMGVLLDKDDLWNFMQSKFSDMIKNYYRKYIINGISNSLVEYTFISKPYARTMENTRNMKNPYIELVDILDIFKLREFNRGLNTEYGARLFQSIVNEGIKDASIIVYQVENNVAYLGEGNHRLAAARMLGVEYVPARVWVRSRSYDTRVDGTLIGKKINEQYHDNAYDKDDPSDPDEWRYERSEMKPSKLGLNTKRL